MKNEEKVPGSGYKKRKGTRYDSLSLSLLALSLWP